MIGSWFIVAGLQFLLQFISFSLFDAGLAWTYFESGFWFSRGIFRSDRVDLMGFYY